MEVARAAQHAVGCLLGAASIERGGEDLDVLLASVALEDIILH